MKEKDQQQQNAVITNIEEINPLERPLFFNCIYAMETVYDAYSEGFIKWNVYQKAIKKIKTNMNGSWMYEFIENNDKDAI